MNYPVWDLGAMGGGFLIALIAVIHVFVSHFAVGGGLFLVMLEKKAYREDSPAILAFVKTHTKFFLLLTMVFGGLTGVAIWFIMTLLNPAASSALIHNFVFGWAIEWVFFLGEIIALIIYLQTFGKMAKARHLIIGWLYFIFAWLSLLTITGIIGFMLTPGEWLATGDFWDGYFNPTLWPQVFFRTFLCLMLAGLYGFVTATFIKDEKLRDTMVRYCAKWLLIPYLLFLASAYWYVQALPAPLADKLFVQSPELVLYGKLFAGFTGLLFLVGLLMAAATPGRFGKILAFVFLAIGLMSMGSFEFIREGGRRPWIIYEYMYSNSILKSELAAVQKRGLLASAKWTEFKEINADNQIQAGRELYRLSCLPCHSIGGPLKDIRRFTASYDEFGLVQKIGALGLTESYMPPFAGNDSEKEALAAYIVQEINGPVVFVAPKFSGEDVAVPLYDPAKDEYLMLAWLEHGMTEIVQSKYFDLGPDSLSIEAYLFRRDEVPELIDSEVVITANDLAMNHNGQVYRLDIDSASVAQKPYWPISVIARTVDGQKIAEWLVMVTVSSDLGCYHCHGGRDGDNYFTDATAANILVSHDRLSKTKLMAQTRRGEKVNCQACHGDDGDQANLSSSLHGFHAAYLQGLGVEACNSCHANGGRTHFFRGLHREMGLDCTSCHGGMRDHALSLLTYEQEQGKAVAHLLGPLNFNNSQEVKARQPFMQQPDCLNCHQDFQPPEQTETFNNWTSSGDELFKRRSDEAGLRCLACHGSPHAIYYQTSEFGEEVGNLAPRQYQGNNLPIGANQGCAKLCHTEDLGEDFHHPNSYRMMRN